MGSIKKHNLCNNHHHIFKQRWHAEKYQKKACMHVEEYRKVTGSMIINLEKLQEYINNLTVHAAEYGGDIILGGKRGTVMLPSY